MKKLIAVVRFRDEKNWFIIHSNDFKTKKAFKSELNYNGLIVIRITEDAE